MLLINQQIPPALRNAPLGFRLSPLDHSPQNFDEGLKVNLRGPGNCHGRLLDRREKASMSMFAIGGGGDHVDETLAGVGNGLSE